MALVDYSDSESDSETVTQQSAAKSVSAISVSSSATTKKPVQKVVDRSNPRKILVNLSSASAKDEDKSNESAEPPAKRARTGGGAFSGFASFLPPPKNAAKPALAASSNASRAPRVGINLKTGAAPGFSRNTGDEEEEPGWDTEATNKQPSIPEGQKPADEVKLVGKPLMFKPLSVSRKAGKKSTAKPPTGLTNPTSAAGSVSSGATTIASPASEPKAELPKKKVSLFSISDETADIAPATSSNGVYEPMFTEELTSNSTEDFAAYDAQYSAAIPSDVVQNQGESLDSIADDMNLSAAARRGLFGRTGAPARSQSATKVINFNIDHEYAHNEEIRAAGEQQVYNPVRAIAPGKHSLRQLVNQVQNQRDALEESFAKGKNNRNEAGARYGWR